MLLKQPDQFSIRPQLVKDFIEVFQTLLWSEDRLKHRLRLELLRGPHKERAFVENKSDKLCKEAGVFPLAKTMYTGSNNGPEKEISVMPNHTEAVFQKTTSIAKFFSDLIEQGKIDHKVFEQRMKRHALRWLDLVGSYIAKDLPFFTLTLA